MNIAVLVGNLGADARVEVVNGNKFVSFNLAHNDSWVGQDGVQHNSISWISCAWNGDGGKLLPFLKKGRSVLVVGNTSVRCYSSAKERKMVAGQNCSVQRIELLGGTPDAVPSRLYTKDGEEVNVYKAFWVAENVVKALGLKETGEVGTLFSRSNDVFQVDKFGFVKATGVSSENTHEE